VTTHSRFRSLLLLFATPLTLTTALIGAPPEDQNIRHVMVISIDGMHSLDLALWVKNNPASALGNLYAQGMKYTNASTTKPSDSIPSTVGIFTGGSPAVGGMYYDDAYNRAWFPPGSNCTGAPGTVIDLKQGINLALDGSTGVNPAKMPMQIVKGSCVPVLPHDMLRVNTVFEVVKSAHGGRHTPRSGPLTTSSTGPREKVSMTSIHPRLPAIRSPRQPRATTLS